MIARASRPGSDAIFLLNVGHELAQEEVAVALAAIGRVDVEAGEAFGRDDQKVANFSLRAQVFNQSPSPAAGERLLVVAEPMQVVEDRESLRLSGGVLLVIVSGNLHAVVHVALEDVTS